VRTEPDSLGEVNVPADKLWGAQTQRSLEHFSIGKDLMPREMIAAYAILKKGAANANHAGKRLDDRVRGLIVQVCDEILAGQHQEMFPLHVWMTGSGTLFNMNVNEVISNRCCQLAGTALGSIRLMCCGPHAGFAELMIPENEPGSSMMPPESGAAHIAAYILAPIEGGRFIVSTLRPGAEIWQLTLKEQR